MWKALPITLVLVVGGASHAVAQKNLPQQIVIDAKVIPDGTIGYVHNGRSILVSEVDRLCKEGKKNNSIKFKAERTGKENDDIKLLLAEARCLGATHIGFSGVYDCENNTGKCQAVPLRKPK